MVVRISDKTQNYSKVTKLLVKPMFICIQQVEGNFIYPHVVGKSVGFPPMYIIVAITIGANVAGIIGIIIFIPICSCIYQLVSEDVLTRLQKVKEVSD